MLEQLRARHPVNLPQGVVRHEIEHLLRDYAEELSQRGLDPGAARIDWSALGEQVRPEAERRVHDRLLLDAVADRDAIAVGDDELEAAVAALARAQGINPGAAARRLAEAAGSTGCAPTCGATRRSAACSATSPRRPRRLPPSRPSRRLRPPRPGPRSQPATAAEPDPIQPREDNSRC